MIKSEEEGKKANPRSMSQSQDYRTQNLNSSNNSRRNSLAQRSRSGSVSGIPMLDKLRKNKSSIITDGMLV